MVFRAGAEYLNHLPGLAHLLDHVVPSDLTRFTVQLPQPV